MDRAYVFICESFITRELCRLVEPVGAGECLDLLPSLSRGSL